MREAIEILVEAVGVSFCEWGLGSARRYARLEQGEAGGLSVDATQMHDLYTPSVVSS